KQRAQLGIGGIEAAVQLLQLLFNPHHILAAFVSGVVTVLAQGIARAVALLQRPFVTFLGVFVAGLRGSATSTLTRLFALGIGAGQLLVVAGELPFHTIEFRFFLFQRGVEFCHAAVATGNVGINGFLHR